MSQKLFSQAYVKHLQQGPFLGRIDPWAEDAHYFHQIHGTMITNLLDQMQEDLLIRGYVAGREASLQIIAKREPDIFVEDMAQMKDETPRLSYSAIAAQLELEAGTAIADEDIELDAIRVYDSDSGTLVTVVEIISPSNKSDFLRIERYREQRSRLFISQGINVVEIDPVRSVQHLIYNKILKSFSYHIAIFLPEDGPYFLGSKLEESLQPFALPLRGDAIRVETQDAYNAGYKTAAIANQIYKNREYIIDALPFPSTLTDAQKESALQAIKEWQDKLEQLREDKP